MRYCICGATIPRRKEKGHREKEYCSDKCRQKAYRQKHKGLLSLRRAQREREARWLNKMDQNYYRETWEDELQRKDKYIQWRDEDIEDLKKKLEWSNVQKDIWEMRNEMLEQRLAEKEAEIVRLQSLLDATSKKKRT